MTPPRKPTATTIQDETNELLRVAHVTFQLDSLSKQLNDRNESQAKHEARMETKFDSIERKLEEIPQKYVSKEYFNERLESMNKDVESINANISKLVWLVISAVIMALLAVVIMNPVKLPVG